MTAVKVLDRVETATSWIEAVADQYVEEQSQLRDASPGVRVFAGDETFVTFVLYGTTAGHPRTLIGSFDDRCLYWQRNPAKPAARVYRVPQVASPRIESDAVHANELRSPADNIKALRERTGLTWEQIARLFGVSRRAVHLWAAGGKLSAANEELLAEIVDLVGATVPMPPEEVRHELLRMRPEVGLSVYDELRARHSSTARDINRAAGPAN